MATWRRLAYFDEIGGGGGYLHTQSEANATWSVAHNLNCQYVIVEVIDASDQAISPLSITFTDANNLVITFTGAVAGKAVISAGGALPQDLSETANPTFNSIKTAAPAGGTSGTWKLGVLVTGVENTLLTTQYIEVDIGGVLYKIPTVTSV